MNPPFPTFAQPPLSGALNPEEDRRERMRKAVTRRKPVRFKQIITEDEQTRLASAETDVLQNALCLFDTTGADNPNTAMHFAQRAMASNQATAIVDSHLNRSNKLMRLFGQHLETLQKIRNKGQQNITVQHVHLGNVNQAIVGNVHGGGGGVH